MENKKYIKFLDYTIKISRDKEYNVQAVAKMLGLPSNRPYNVQCRIIISFLKKKSKTNKVIKKLLDSAKSEKKLCNYLVEILYLLFNPKNFPNKAPILITENKYKNLLKKEKNNTITNREKLLLDEALNVKYCHCIKKLYLKNIFLENILEKRPKYNPYAICMSSIYKNRNIDPPHKASYTCRDKYKWYQKF